MSSTGSEIERNMSLAYFQYRQAENINFCRFQWWRRALPRGDFRAKSSAIHCSQTGSHAQTKVKFEDESTRGTACRSKRFSDIERHATEALQPIHRSPNFLKAQRKLYKPIDM